jgi:CheY-like chemotaxis protein
MSEQSLQIRCSNCTFSFEPLEASWCSCLVPTRSLVCPHCLRCFCNASHRYKQSFWASAPETLWDQRMELHAGAAHLDGDTPLDLQKLARPLVLVVEDDPRIQRMMAEAVDELGYGHLVARDGMEGLELARRYGPDMILTDALMPRLDGREMCRLLKEDPATSGIKCVVITGLYTRTHYRNEAVSCFHVDDYVHKPVDFNQLRALLQKHIG